MRKIIITADSTADVTPELKKEFGLEIMRFSLNTGNACFPDRVEEPDKMLRKGQITRTFSTIWLKKITI